MIFLMKASIFYSMLFVTAITLIATADYSDAELKPRNNSTLTLRSAATMQNNDAFTPVYYNVTDSTVTTHIR